MRFGVVALRRVGSRGWVPQKSITALGKSSWRRNRVHDFAAVTPRAISAVFHRRTRGGKSRTASQRTLAPNMVAQPWFASVPLKPHVQTPLVAASSLCGPATGQGQYYRVRSTIGGCGDNERGRSAVSRRRHRTVPACAAPESAKEMDSSRLAVERPRITSRVLVMSIGLGRGHVLGCYQIARGPKSR